MTKKNFTVEEFSQAFQDAIVDEGLTSRADYELQGIIDDVKGWEGTDDAVDFTMTLEEAVKKEVEQYRNYVEMMNVIFGI